MKIVSHTRHIDEDTFQPIVRMVVDLPMELAQDLKALHGLDSENVFGLLGERFAQACKEYDAKLKANEKHI